MYLTNARRRLAHYGHSLHHSQPGRMIPLGLQTGRALPAKSQDECADLPALLCRWEVAEEPLAVAEDQTIGIGAMLMHWMPVH